MTAPIIQHRDTRHPFDPNCACSDCFNTEQRRLYVHMYGSHAREVGRFYRGLWLAIALSIPLWGVLGYVVHDAYARTNQPHPIKAPESLLRARHACPNTASIPECRAALRRAYSAVAWQRHARLTKHGYGVQHALRLASALYNVPMRELRAVGTCESHLQPSSQNRTSTAAGLFQFLDSTWARAGIPGFSVFDAYANAIAAARLVHNDGGWREWQCKP